MKKIKYTNENENENSGEIQTLGCLQDFNKINGKNKSMTLEDLFGQCLKLIPKAGKETVNNILKYFKTFVSLHEKLSEFTTEEERIQFLNSLLKGTRVQSEVPKILVDLLFK